MSKKVTTKASARKRGLIEFIAGAALAAIGGIATYASYNAADEGETYTVYTGVIALGIVYAGIGLWHIAFPKVDKKDETKELAQDAEVVDAETVKEED